MEKVSIIIPTHNEGFWLQRTVDSILMNIIDINFEILIIADSITDNSLNFLEKKTYRLENILCYETDFNSLCKNKNYGAEKSSGDILLFVDSHVLIENNSINEIIRLLNLPDAGLVSLGIKVYGDEGNIGYIYTIADYLFSSSWDGSDDLKHNPYIEVPAVIGAFMGVKKKNFFKIGSFDDNFTRWGIEDIDISIRSWMFGYNNYISPNKYVTHLFKTHSQFQLYETDIDFNILCVLGSLDNCDFGLSTIDTLSKHEGFIKNICNVVANPNYWSRREYLLKNRTRSFKQYLSKYEKYLAFLRK